MAFISKQSRNICVNKLRLKGEKILEQFFILYYIIFFQNKYILLVANIIMPATGVSLCCESGPNGGLL
jgi:hypothetical protein